ncbi:MipA/OmpV family protein [Escherichia coli]
MNQSIHQCHPRKLHTASSALSLLAGSLCLLMPLQSQAQQHATETPTSIFGDKTEITVGLGAAVTPRYLGAKDSRAMPLPTLSIYRGIFFADSIRGLGMEYLTQSGLYASVAIGYDFGRTEKDSDWRPGSKRLQGMGEVKGATTANFLLAQELTSWLSVNGEAEVRIAGHERGNRYRLGLESTILNAVDDVVTLGVNVHAGDGRYNRTYFGVSAEQAQASRFSRFNAESGVYAYSLSADWHHDFSKRWTMSVGVNVMEFSDKARKSPVVEEKTGVTGFATLHYAF